MKILALVVSTVLLIACSAPKQDAPMPGAPSGASGAAAAKQYPMHGKIVSLDPAAKSAKIDAGPIGDMGAMTMEYSIRTADDFAKLTVGANIDATAFVDGEGNYTVGNITVAK